MLRGALHIVIPLLAVLPACAGDEEDTPPEDDGFLVLAQADWEVPAGTEAYYCIRKTLEEDLYLAGFEAIVSPGNHHTAVTAGLPLGPDGIVECGVSEQNYASSLYESATGTDRFVLPEGVAAMIPAGHQLNINFHVLNATDETLRGTTGTRYLPADPDVSEIATAVYMGRVTLQVPPGESTQMGVCDITQDATLFGVFPHMHVFGSHMKVVVNSAADGTRTILDTPYVFLDDKDFVAFDPIDVAPGDSIEVYCSYDNPTDQTIPWGPEDYTGEMCFAATYLYPAAGWNSACAQ